MNIFEFDHRLFEIKAQKKFAKAETKGNVNGGKIMRTRMAGSGLKVLLA